MSNKRLDLVGFKVSEFQCSDPADDNHETVPAQNGGDRIDG
jgi:hypothetical protein